MLFKDSDLPDDPLTREMFEVARALHSMSIEYLPGADYFDDAAVDEHFQKLVVTPALLVARDTYTISDATRGALLVWPFYRANKDLALDFPPAIQEKLERMAEIADVIKQLSFKTKIPAAELLELRKNLDLTYEDLTIIKVHAYQQLRLTLEGAYAPETNPDLIESLMRMSKKMIENGSMLCAEQHEDRVTPLNGIITGTIRDIKSAFEERGWELPDLRGDSLGFTI